MLNKSVAPLIADGSRRRKYYAGRIETTYEFEPEHGFSAAGRSDYVNAAVFEVFIGAVQDMLLIATKLSVEMHIFKHIYIITRRSAKFNINNNFNLTEAHLLRHPFHACAEFFGNTKYLNYTLIFACKVRAIML